jgi:RNA methyltransferase, TrmH family
VAPGTPPPGEVTAAWERGVRVYDLAPGVLERVAGTVSPQPVLAVVPMVDRPLGQLAGPTVDGRPVVVCVDVRDPGNLGTVIRSSEAAGVAGVICCDGTVDVYNPKCVRASAGAVFHVPLVVGGDPVSTLETLRSSGRRCLGSAAGGGVAYTDADLAEAPVLVLGNEAAGLPDELLASLDGVVHIPMQGRSDSLNVAVASAVLCFEAARQRRAAVEVSTVAAANA